MTFEIPNVGFNQTHRLKFQYDEITTSEYVRAFMHLLGVEFYTGNISVDGYIRFIETGSRDALYIRGDKGYARNLSEIELIDEDGSRISYKEYTLKYYPDMRHIIDEQIKQYKL